MSDIASADAIADLVATIDRWSASFAAENPVVIAVDRATDADLAATPGGAPSPGRARWYIRLRGEAKEFTTVWLTVGQRTLRYETYVMPAPRDNREAVFDNVLRRNERLIGAHFSIGHEDALYLRGELPVGAVNDDELDRIVGSLYVYVEDAFATLIALGFASMFAG